MKSDHKAQGDTRHGSYGRLFVMVALHFVAMYVLMYAMVDRAGNVYHHLNQFYMAGLMTASMLLIELPIMGAMYPRRKANIGIAAAAAAVLVGLFLLLRAQVGITDGQFLRSMIPHHAGAILMCEQASLQDAEVQELCRGIIASQRSEIDLMRRKLAE